MNGLVPVAALRFREALAGRILWLLPLHFLLALAAARSLPGPSDAARVQAADASALGLAAVLGLVAAAVLGAAPLPGERGRARGSLVLAAPPSAAARVLGTAFGTGMALLLLLLGLCASAMAAVDAGVGTARSEPRAYLRASSLDGGAADPGDEGLVWLTADAPEAEVSFPRLPPSAVLVADCRVRVGREGTMPGWKRASVRFEGGPGGTSTTRVRTGLMGPFRVEVPAGTARVFLAREKGNLDLGLRLEGIRVDAGPRPRALSRMLHAGALFAGLLGVMGAAMAVSTVAGAGVAAAGALSLALLSLFRTVFLGAAATLAYAGAMEKAMEASTRAGHGHAEALTGTPPAFAPVFRALAAALPDGTRFDLGAAVAANEVPDPGDATRALLLGAALAALFLGLAVLGARRRP